MRHTWPSRELGESQKGGESSRALGVAPDYGVEISGVLHSIEDIKLLSSSLLGSG